MPKSARTPTVTPEKQPVTADETHTVPKESGTDPAMVVFTSMVEYAMLILLVAFALSLFASHYRDSIVRAVQRVPAATR